jgi:superfamily II DNA or RNA helicase
MIRIIEGPTKLKLVGEDWELKTLHLLFRVHPKGYEHAPSHKAFVMTNGQDGWDGYISPIRIYQRGTADCLRGHRDRIIAACLEKGIETDTSQCLVSPFKTLTTDDIPDDIVVADFKLDQYQREAIVRWLNAGMGINKIAVSGGKSCAFAAVAAMIKRRFPTERILYVTQSERLVRQAYKDFTGFLPGFDITQYGGSAKDNTGKDIVIATIAMIWRNRQELTQTKWFREFTAVLVDEAHHASSSSAKQLLMQLPCFFRLGASDTVHIEDKVKSDTMVGLLGPVRYTVPVATYIALGRSAKPTIYLVENREWINKHKKYPHQAEPNTPAWCLVEGDWKRGTYVGPVYERDENGEIVMRKVRELEGTNDTKVDAAGRVILRKVQDADKQGGYTWQDREGHVVSAADMEYDPGLSTLVDSKTANWIEVLKPVVLDGYHSVQFKGDDHAFDVDSRYCILDRVIDKAITSFKERNLLIVEWAKYYSKVNNWPTLVVCTRTMHVLILETLLKRALGDDMVQVLFSDHTSKQRDEAFDWFKSTPGSVLISPLVKEGVSINEIKAGIISDYITGAEAFGQILGRFIRKKKEGDNTAFITAFLDVQHPSLRKGSRAMFSRLFNIRGYTFAYPCLGPSTIASAKVYERLDE